MERQARLMPSVPSLSRAIEEKEVADAVGKLTAGKACGPDQIPPELVMRAGQNLIPHLTRLFNTIWSTAQWPSEWSMGLIVPIHKSGDARDPDNYRGIALTSVLSKVFELVVNERLVMWTEESSTLVDEQGGFRRGRATVDQLLILSEITAMRKENNLPTFLAFLDVRKAYDRVWKPGLIQTLLDCGIGGRIWFLVKEMLLNVQRSVMINGTRSEPVRCDTGVPQGAVLSPLLYACFINRFALLLKEKGLGVDVFGRKVAILLYADDIVLLANSPAELQQMLDLAAEFAKRWRFQFNHKSGKSNIVICGSRSLNEVHILSIHGSYVEIVLVW